ncbi:MAG: hypothetical protein IKG08_03720 [Eubacterium sp.]|nr:hypothetical protein [Eubacterium sp.]
MKKKLLALVLAAVMILGFMPKNVKADNSVTVYLSLSENGGYLTDTDDEAIALREITVPYFDLGYYYGLSDFYYNTEHYGSTDPDDPWNYYVGLQPGTQQNAAENGVTLLHLLIFAMEVYQLGIDPSLAGHGQLKPYMELVDSYDSTKSFTATAGDTMISISGTPGSLYFNNYWNMDDLGTYPDNWMYFKNYMIPIATPGLGSTADQILLSEGDVITMGHFGTYGMYDSRPGTFSYARLANNGITRKISVSQGAQVSLVFGYASADIMYPTTTSQSDFQQVVPVYRFAEDNTTSYGISTYTDWTSIGNTNVDGTITIDTTNWPLGTYMITIPGIEGDIYQWEVYMGYGYICTPGGILIEVY